jgi:DNA mismatch endonuclease (patch repair protein)
MRRVRSKSTKPELIVRGIVRRLGLHYRLHRQDLPGQPDLVLIDPRLVIFVHGCFWHGHDCAAADLPKSNVPYWEAKRRRNVRRDRRNINVLRKLGWSVMVLWECRIKKTNSVAKRISRFLSERECARKN